MNSLDQLIREMNPVLRGGQYVWLIEGPDLRYTAKEVEERCKPILEIFKGKS